MKKQNKPAMKPLSDLTLMDRFLFACAMEDPVILQTVLEIILEKEIHLKERIQAEKELRTAPWLRSVRLDVISMDYEENVYNTEVQKKNTGNLLKRSRFYQALVDSSLLAPGEIDFNKMPSAYLIMIAPFDLFVEGKYCYTFQMKCKEVESLWMTDGATRIFLNTHGKNPEEVNEALVELLHYFEQTTDEAASQSSSRIKEIHRRVSQIKSSEKIGVRYMQEWEERAYELQEAREQGIEYGIEQGMERGMERGMECGIRALVQDNLEEGVSKEKILLKLQKRFSMDAAKADAYFERFSKGGN